MQSNPFLERRNTVKRISISVLMAGLLIGLTGCGGDSNEPKPVTEMEDFAYVNTQVYTQNRESVDDITTLNAWLRANPSKKVVSFSGVLAYREGVSGYIVYFVSGDNSKQKFWRVNRSDEPEIFVHGIRSLQTWKDAHPNARVVALSAVPSYSGGVREFTVCYEK